LAEHEENAIGSRFGFHGEGPFRRLGYLGSVNARFGQDARESPFGLPDSTAAHLFAMGLAIAGKPLARQQQQAQTN
jgi:hypothetical protein